MKTYKIPVSWECCGFVSVKAKSVEDALVKFQEQEDDFPLPTESEYIDGSFRREDDINIIKLYNINK